MACTHHADGAHDRIASHQLRELDAQRAPELEVCHLGSARETRCSCAHNPYSAFEIDRDAVVAGRRVNRKWVSFLRQHVEGVWRAPRSHTWILIVSPFMIVTEKTGGTRAGVRGCRDERGHESTYVGAHGEQMKIDIQNRFVDSAGVGFHLRRHASILHQRQISTNTKITRT